MVAPWVSISAPDAFIKETLLLGLMILKLFSYAVFKGITDPMEPASMMLFSWYDGEQSFGLGLLLLYSIHRVGVLFVLLLVFSTGTYIYMCHIVSFMYTGVLLLLPSSCCCSFYFLAGLCV